MKYKYTKTIYSARELLIVIYHLNMPNSVWMEKKQIFSSLK